MHTRIKQAKHLNAAIKPEEVDEEEEEDSTQDEDGGDGANDDISDDPAAIRAR